MGLVKNVLSSLLRHNESKAKTQLAENPASRFRIEQLEPRLLLSADLAQQPDLPDSPQNSNDSAIVLVQDLPATEKITIDPTSGEWRVTSDEWNQPETRNPKPETLSSEAVKPLVDEAISQLAQFGFSGEELQRARDAEFEIVNLPGWTLAETSEDGIKIDGNANGFDWYIDPTPSDNSEFVQNGTELKAVAGSEADGRVDLLTVLTHELGHYLGLSHNDGSDRTLAFMQADIRPGIRRIAGEWNQPETRNPEPETPALITSPLTPYASRASDLEQLTETLRIANGPPESQALTLAPTISWISDTDGYWDDASNWRDLNGVSRVPTSTDDALIDRPNSNPTITIRWGDQSAHSLLSNESLVIAGGSLTLSADSEINAEFTQTGGTLAGSGTLVINGIFTANQPIASTDLALTAAADDTVGPTLLTSSVTPTTILTPGPFEFTATFSEELATTGLDQEDVVLTYGGDSQYPIAPSGFTYDAATRQLTVQFFSLWGNEIYTLTLVSGPTGFRDLAGNPLDGDPSQPGGDDFVVNFGVVSQSQSFLPLGRTIPPGSLVYASNTDIIGAFLSPGDPEIYAVDLNPGQQLAVGLFPTAGAQGLLEVFDPNGVLVVSAASVDFGDRVFLLDLSVSVGGTYQFEVKTLNGTGLYKLGFLLNSSLDQEIYTSPGSNDSIATAQNINTSAVAPARGASRLAVEGDIDPAGDADVYSMQLAAGQPTTLIAARGDPFEALVSLELLDSSGVTLASGVDAVDGVTHRIVGFLPTQTGTYYARVFSSEPTRYQLVITRGADFEQEPNSTVLTAQDIGHSGQVLGALAKASRGDAAVKVAVLTSSDSGSLLSQLNDDTWFDFDALAVSASQIDTIEELDAFDVVLIGDSASRALLEQVASALRDWVQMGRAVVGTGGLIAAAGNSSGTPIWQINEIIPVSIWGASSYLTDPSVDILDSAHPVTQGIADFSITGSLEYQANGFAWGDMLAAANGQPAVVVAPVYGPSLIDNSYGNSVWLGLDYFTGSSAVRTGSADRLLEQALAWASGVDEVDNYKFSASVGDQLVITTSTPLSGPHQPQNLLDPQLELYGPQGQLMASDADSADDGKNAVIAFTIPTGEAGVYTVRVRGVNSGEYTLAISGATSVPGLAPFVIDASPVISLALVLQFSEGIRLDTVDTSDLSIDGGATVTGVEFADGRTVRFLLSIPNTDLAYHYTLTAGAVLDLEGQAGLAYEGSFAVDRLGPKVISQTPAATSVAPLDVLTLSMSEALDPASVSFEDIVSFTGPGGISLLDQVFDISSIGSNITIHFSPQFTTGRYTVVIGPDAADAVGNLMDQDQDGLNGQENDTYTASIDILAPDLAVTDFQAPATAVIGAQIAVSWTVTNQGTAPAPADWYDNLYLSRDPLLGSGDMFVSSEFISSQTPLAAGASYTVNRNITIPSVASGSWYLLALADALNQQGETSDTNNIRAVALEVSGPDLVVTDLQAPASAGIGTQIAVSWTVTNEGTAPAPADWYDYLILSRDPLWDSGDTFVWVEDIFTQTPLAAGASYTISRNVTIPAVDLGSWYLLAIADVVSNQSESNETNNLRAVALEVLQGPDLAVTDLQAPATLVTGGQAAVSWTVTNQGATPAAADWYDSLYLSRDQTFNALNDTYVSTQFISAETPLAAGASYTISHNIRIPSVETGNWYLLVKADNGNSQGETDETNNMRASALVVPAPPLNAVAPLGSLIYDISLTGALDAPGEVNSFTINFDAAQQATLSMVPQDASLRGQLELRDANGNLLASATANAAGELVTLQNEAVVTSGVHTVRIISLDGTGVYAARLLLNAAQEIESYGSSSNNDLLSAQDINGSAISLQGAADRVAVLGLPDGTGGKDFYSFTLDAGQVATLVVARTDGITGGLAVELRDAAGNLLALGLESAENVYSAIRGFLAHETGAYYVGVSGLSNVEYSLVITRSADFELEPNGDVAGAQDISQNDQVLGALGERGIGSGGSIRVAVLNAGNAGQLISQLNNDSFFDFTAISVSGADIDTVAELSNYDVVVIGDPSSRSLLQAVAAALRAWVEAGGGVVGTGWLVLTAGNYYGAPITDINAVIPVNTAVDYNYFFNPTLTIVDNTHPVTQGLSNFAPGDYVEYSTGGVDSQGATVLAMVSGQPVVVVGGAGFGRAVYLGPIYSQSSSSLRTGTADQLLEQAVAWAGALDRADQYLVRANGGDNLLVTTTTPGDGTGEPGNSLDPILELYDPSGILVASNNNGAADGRNALINHSAATSGTYRIRVAPVVGSGDYIITIAGATRSTTVPLEVTSSSVSDGTSFNTFPATIDISFSQPLLLTTLQAADLTINGSPATGVTILDARTARFNIGGLVGVDGLYTVALEAGVVGDTRGNTNLAFAFEFSLDTSKPVVIASSIVSGAVLPPGPLVYTAGFNEDLAVAGLNAADVTLVESFSGTPIAVSFFSYDPSTNHITANFPAIGDGNYTLTLASTSSGFRDLVGNLLNGAPSFPLPSGEGNAASDAFVVNFVVDTTTAELPALEAVKPLGSQIYEGSVLGQFHEVGDVDDYQIAIDAGQTVTVVFVPESGSLVGRVELVDGSNTVLGAATATGAGSAVALQAVPIVTGGSYTVRLSSVGGIGGYEVQVILNSLVESEAYEAVVIDPVTGPLTIFDTFHFRSNEGVNSVGNTAGDRQRFGAQVTPSGDPTVVSATPSQGGTVRTLSFSPTDGSPDRYLRSMTFSASLAGAWSITATRGTETAGPVLTSAIANPQLVPFVNNLQVSGTGLSPRVRWELPDLTGFDINNIRVEVFDDVIDESIFQSSNLAASTTEFIVPEGVIELGGQYIFAVQLRDTQGGELENRSRTFTQVAYEPVLDATTLEQAAGDISSSAIALGGGAQRLAVVGQSDERADYYGFGLSVGQGASLVLTNLAPSGSVGLELYDGTGTLLARGVSGAENVDQSISSFVAPAAGTYYVRVSGDPGQFYSLVITRGADFELETRTGAVTQDISVTDQVLSALQGSPGGGGGSSVIRVAVHSGSYGGTAVSQLNDDTFFDFQAVAVNGNQIDTLEELNAYDVVVIGDNSREGELATFAPALRAWVEAGGGVVGTGWLVYSAGNSTGVPMSDIDAIIPVNTTVYYNYVYAPTLSILDSSHPITQGLANFSVGTYVEFSSAGIDGGSSVLATASGQAAVVAATINHGRGVYLGPIYLGGAGSALQSGSADQLLEQSVAWAGRGIDRGDQYNLSANPGDNLLITTATPGDGTGEPVNLLDPRLELYNPQGLLIATDDNSAADGRNARISYSVPSGSGGTYQIRIFRTNSGAEAGEYIVKVNGATGISGVGPSIIATNPGNGQNLADPPTELIVTFSEALRTDTVATTDLLLESGGTVTGFELVDGRTIRFRLSIPDLEQAFSYTLADGAFLDLQGTASLAYQGSFNIDHTGPRVVAQIPALQSSAPFNQLVLNFNEALDPASVTTADIMSFTGPGGVNLTAQISSVSVTGANLTVRFNNQNAQGTYTMLIGPNIADIVGNLTDQNQNRSGGETADRYTATIDLQSPDLRVESVRAPPSANFGAAIEVSWTVRNVGSDPAREGWSDRVWLSLDPSLSLDDTLLLTQASNAQPLLPGALHEYNRTVSVILPLTASVAPGSHYILLQTDALATQPESSETNNISVSAISLALPPLPDLLVSSIDAPLEALSGQLIPIAWTVANQGTKDVSGSFADQVFLSTDTAVGGDQLFGTFTFEGTLPAGQSITRIQTITLPINLSGDRWFIIKTDSSGQIFEHVNEDNNVRVDDRPIVIRLAPVPNLIVTSVTPPTEAFSGQETVVQWQVKNTGIGATSAPQWYDSVYLSTDRTLDQFDIFLGQATNPSYLAVGDSYANSLTVRLPRGIDSNYYYLVKTDAFSQVFEADREDDNITVSEITRVRLTPPPDLQVTSVNAPLQAFSGQSMSLSWTVTNEGPGRTLESTWHDQIYMSADNTLDNADRLLTSTHHAGVLNPGASYSVTQAVALPIGVSGDYFFFLRTDAFNSVYEHAFESNNVGHDTTATRINLTPPPDLEVESVTAPTAALASFPLTVSYRVTNFGSTDTPESLWEDAIYLSSDASLDAAGDIRLGTLAHYGPLAVDQSYDRNTTFDIPNGLTGAFYVFVQTDRANQVFEINNDNNILTAVNTVLIDSRPPDLRVTAAALSSPTAEAGKQVQWNATIQNLGAGPTRLTSWSDQIIATTDGVIGGNDDVVLATVIHNGSLDSAASYSIGGVIAIPFTFIGNYQIFVVTDLGRAVYEGVNDNNNASHVLSLTVTRQTPDLQVVAITAPNSAAAGSTISLSWRVENLGTNRTNANFWYDEVLLSLDQAASLNDRSIAIVRRTNALNPAEGYDVAGNFTIPTDLTSGNYYVIVRTDQNNAVLEDPLEGNNVRATAAPVTIAAPGAIEAPDLIVTAVDAPIEAFSGQMFSLTFTVQNAGENDASGKWYELIYLSRDQFFDRDSDRFVGTMEHEGGLAAGEVYTTIGAGFIPKGFSGPFYVFVLVDSTNRVFEGTHELNNTGYDPVSMDVSLLPPVDLVVGTIAVGISTIPDYPVLAQRITIDYSIRNQGDNTAFGNWFDSIYISADEQWDVNDALLGRFEHIGNVPGHTSYSGRVSQALLVGLVPGDYHVIIRSDILNHITEINEENNIGASLDQVAIEMAVLELETADTGMLIRGFPIYYRMNVGSGETIRVRLESEWDDAINELYIRYGELPTRSQFDFYFRNAFAADQDVIIPSTREGTYYILLHTQTLPVRESGFPIYTIVANVLPFAVERLSTNRAGNVGQITLQIEGSKFDQLTRVELAGQSEVIAPIWVRRENPTLILATFDLSGVTPGFYDMRAVSEGDDLEFNQEAGEYVLVHRIFGESTLSSALEVVEGGGPVLTYGLNLPSSARYGEVFTFSLDIANRGANDLPVPVLMVTSPNGTPISLTSDVEVDALTELQIIAVGRLRSAVLIPGESVSVPLFARAVMEPSSQFIVTDLISPETPLNWDELETLYRYDSSDEEWNSTWANFKTLVGDSVGKFHEALRRSASDLAFGESKVFTASELLLDLLARAGSGQRDPSGFVSLSSESTQAVNREIDRLSGAIPINPSGLLDDPIPSDPVLLAKLLAAEGFWGAALPEWFAIYGADAGNILDAFITTNSTRPTLPGRFNFTNGSSIVDGRGFGLMNGFKNSDITKQTMTQLMGAAVQSINHIVKRLGCDTLEGRYPIDDERLIFLKSFLEVVRDPVNTMLVWEGLDIPSRMAGGVSGYSDATGQSRMDTRDISGFVDIIKRYKNGKLVAIDVKLDVQIFITEGFDFNPGGTGDGVVAPLVESLRFLEDHDWAYDVPWTVSFTPDPVAPRRLQCCSTPDCRTPPPPPPKRPNGPIQKVDSVRSRDPNDIVGPAGFGDEQWVTATETLPYTIRFENAADATAPAQQVVITQQLDSDLDFRTFRVDDFGFGDLRFDLPANRPFYNERLDLRESRGYFVDVSASIDATTGVATWTITTIDPATGEQPADALTGFLPTNDENGRGEGFVSYTVRAKRTAQTGDRIDAEARIIFDTEEPIDTPPIFNTLDAAAPASSANALSSSDNTGALNVEAAETIVETTEFLVSWAGADDDNGSAIRDFTIYVSVNGGPFEIWLLDTPLTESLYLGEAGNSYAFYSVARDNAGNEEAAPETADAVIIVVGPPGGIAGVSYEDIDGDGFRDQGEPGLAGRTIFIDANANGTFDAGEISTITDTSGAYAFTGLQAGTSLVIAQSLQVGWLVTAPATGAHYIVIVSGQTLADNDFGNFRLAEIRGITFNDLNANGLQDAGESGLAGWTIYIDANNNGQREATERTVVTNDAGAYLLTNLGPGNAVVRQEAQAGWGQTKPSSGKYEVAMTSGLLAEQRDFGVVELGSLSGIKFEDIDGDSVRDAGEPGLPGWTIFIDANANGLLDAGETSAVTDETGQYRFAGLLPGAYIVAEVAQDGWLQTSPRSQGALTSGITIQTGSGSLSTTGSAALLYTPDELLISGGTVSASVPGSVSEGLTRLSDLRSDPRFTELDGRGITAVILDTGVNLDHPFFGPDLNHDGIADRIVYQYDFADNDSDASDRTGHGSVIASLIGSQDNTYRGVAFGADLIMLKVFEDDGPGYFSYLEKGLQWVVQHVADYNIGVVNLSLGDGSNWDHAVTQYGLGDEFAALAACNVIVVAAAGNRFYEVGGALGVAYPAADPAVLAIGAVWSGDFGGPWRFSSGAVDYSTGADRITSFSQRHRDLTDTFAPGARLTGAGYNDGTRTMQGTSQAAAFVSGAAALAQQAAHETLGRGLSTGEFATLLRASGDLITDGDDEVDNVINTGLQFPRLDMVRLIELIASLQDQPIDPGGGSNTGSTQVPLVQQAAAGVHTISLAAGGNLIDLNFGNFKLGTINGTVFTDENRDGQPQPGESGLAGSSVFIDVNGNGTLDAGEENSVTDASGLYAFANIGPGAHVVKVVPPTNEVATTSNPTLVTMTSGLAASAEFGFMPPSLVVTLFTASPSGFTARFNFPVDSRVLNLYGTETGGFGPADVTIVGALSGAVKGSLVVSSNASEITFIKTGGVLLPDTYNVTLRSATSGFRNATVGLLDGNHDGIGGDNYITSFTVSPTTDVVVSISDFTRGPGQAVNVTTTEIGIPVMLSDGTAVTVVDFIVNYDPTLLTITGAVTGIELPAASQVAVSLNTSGQAHVTVFSDTPFSLDSIPRSIQLVKLIARVPATAPYGASHILHLANVSVNAGTTPLSADDALHVVAYLGDATANRSYSALDGQRILRVAGGLDTGFAPFIMIDPVIIADITGDGSVTSLDATRILQEVIGIDRLEIPPLPSVNVAPTLAPIANQTVQENSLLSFTASAKDDNKDPLLYSLVTPPSGAKINPLTGVFSWTPTQTQAGLYNVTLHVSDGVLGAERIVQINVTETADLIFNVTIDDPAGSFAVYYDAIEAHVRAAGLEWDAIIAGSASLEVYVGFTTSIPRATGRSFIGSLVENIGTFEVLEQGATAEIRTGTDPNDADPDIEILFNPTYLTDELWLDPDPFLRTAAVPSNKTDAMSVFLHELGHAFAFNGWRDSESGEIPGDYESTFDAQVNFDGSNFYFEGAHAVGVYGAPVPLTFGNYGHLGNDAPRPGEDLIPDLMNGVVFFRGERYQISSHDVAILADVGVPVVDDVVASATMIPGALQSNPSSAPGSDSVTNESAETTRPARTQVLANDAPDPQETELAASNEAQRSSTTEANLALMSELNVNHGDSDRAINFELIASELGEKVRVGLTDAEPTVISANVFPVTAIERDNIMTAISSSVGMTLEKTNTPFGNASPKAAPWFDNDKREVHAERAVATIDAPWDDLNDSIHYSQHKVPQKMFLVYGRRTNVALPSVS